MIRLLLAMLIAIAPALASAQVVSISERREADGSVTLVHEVLVDAPQAELWSAISTAGGWRGWAAPVARMIDGETLETSYTSSAPIGESSRIRQHFAAVLPGRMLVFRTTHAPTGFPHFDLLRRVTHFFELEPASGGVRVRLTGTGYVDSAEGRQLLGFFREGNRIALDRLRRRFAEGPVDWARVASDGMRQR